MKEKQFIIITWFYIILGMIASIVFWISKDDQTIPFIITIFLLVIGYVASLFIFGKEGKKNETRKDCCRQFRRNRQCNIQNI